MAPLVVLVAFVQASRSVNEVPVLPIAAAVVEIVVVALPWLNRATATSPLASRLASTRRVPSLETWVACRPSVSWLMAIRFGVLQDRLASPATCDREVVAGDQRRGHDRPQREVAAHLGVGHAAPADLHHVRVVEPPGRGVARPAAR